jgi:hypothetical protein
MPNIYIEILPYYPPLELLKAQLVNKDFWIFMFLSFQSFLFQKEMKNIFGKILKSILKAIWKSKVKN